MVKKEDDRKFIIFRVKTERTRKYIRKNGLITCAKLILTKGNQNKKYASNSSQNDSVFLMVIHEITDPKYKLIIHDEIKRQYG